MENNEVQLIKLNSARRALIEASSLDEIKEIIDSALAFRIYAKAAKMGIEMQNNCAEINLRAQRKAGELLKEMEKNKGGKPEQQTYQSQDETSKTHPKLKDLGVNKTQSYRWQKIADVPQETFEEHINQTKSKSNELTTSSVLKIANQLNKEEKHTTEKSDEMCAVSDLYELINAGKKFKTIYADPPWQYSNQSTRSATDTQYETMSIDDICNLPISQLSDDVCHLHLWTTNSFLREAFLVIDSWGFNYKSCFVWVKPKLGIGNYWRVSHEFLLLGTKGSCTFIDKSQKSWEELNRTKHSEKPEEIRKKIEKVSPSPYLELFARRTSPGWISWGNDIKRDLFNESAFSLSTGS